MPERGCRQILRRSDALRSGAIIADPYLRYLADQLDAAAADSAHGSTLRHAEEPWMLRIELVGEIDVRLVAGIHCKRRLHRAQVDVDDRDEVLKREGHRNAALSDRNAEAYGVRRGVELHVTAGEHVGAKHHVVAVAPQIAEYRIISFGIRRAAET